MALKGAIIGDIIGSQYEFRKPKGFDYKTAILLSDKCHFTDDTVLSLATKYALQNDISFTEAYKFFGLKYRNAGYGSSFSEWLDDDTSTPYNSYGNGSAMRISYIVDYYNKYSDLDKIVKATIRSAICTHNHIEGVLGAKTVAVCLWMAKQGFHKYQILNFCNCVYSKYEYAYSSEHSLDELRKIYRWNETCQGSVPVAIRCVYEANNYTEFIRNVLSLDCDADTICAIGGGIAEELFDNSDDKILKQSDEILNKYLDDYLLKIFYKKL